MLTTLLGVALAFAGASLYAVGVALQALEARAVSTDHALRLSLLRGLATRKRWLMGTFFAFLGWLCEAGALLLVPLSIVQPALAFGMIVLLVMGARILKEDFGRRELIGVSCIIVGVGGIALISPARTINNAEPTALAIVIMAFAILSLAPRALHNTGRVTSLIVTFGAGLAYAWSALMSKLIADALAVKDIPLLLLWSIPAIASGILGLTNEMTALQTRRASEVAPIVFATHMLIPVLLSPTLVGERWRLPALMIASIATVAAGAALLASSRVVSDVVRAGVAGSLDMYPSSGPSHKA